MSEYLFLYRGGSRPTSPQDAQAVMQRYDWLEIPPSGTSCNSARSPARRKHHDAPCFVGKPRIAILRGRILLTRLDNTGHQAQTDEHERASDDPDLTDAQTRCAVCQPGNNEQRPDQVHHHVSHRIPRN